MRLLRQIAITAGLVLASTALAPRAAEAQFVVKDPFALLQRAEQFRRAVRAYREARHYYDEWQKWQGAWMLTQASLKGLDAHKHDYLRSWLQRERARAEANILSEGHDAWVIAHNRRNPTAAELAYRRLSQIVDRNIQKTDWPEMRLLARNAAAVETTVTDSMESVGAYREEQEWLDRELDEIEDVLKIKDADFTTLSQVQIQTLDAWATLLSARQLKYQNRMLAAQNQMAALEAIARNNEMKATMQAEFDRRHELGKWMNFDVAADWAAFTRGSR